MIIIHSVPDHKKSVPVMLAKIKMYGLDKSSFTLPHAQHEKENEKINEILWSLPGKVLHIDPADILCKSGTCMLGEDEKLYYYDNSHLTEKGAKLLLPALIKSLP